MQNIQSVPGGGSRFGGRALKELTRFGQDFGSNEFGNTINQLLNLARTGGAVGTGTAAAAGINSANQVGQFSQFGAGAGAANLNQSVQGTIGNLFTLNQLQGQQQLSNTSPFRFPGRNP